MVCARGHSFDIARSGYINLLQPQERRAKHPGDTLEAVAARRRLHDLGVTGPLRSGIADAVAATSNDAVLDAGSGEGFYLGTLQRDTGCAAHGIDISTRAIDAAARRYPAAEWVVANADRFVPYSDKSFSVVLSITGRMNPPEYRRVLRDGGRLIVAVSAPNDLIELRGSGRDRLPPTLEKFATGFTLAAKQRISTCAQLDAAAVRDVLLSIYRPIQPRPPEAARVTFSLDLLVFRVS